MAPQCEAGPQPAILHPLDDFHNDNDDDREIADNDENNDDDDNVGDLVLIQHFQNHPEQMHQAEQIQPHPHPQLQVQQLPPPRHLSPQDRSLLVDIASTFEYLGVDLVRHVVLASLYPAPSAAGPSAHNAQQHTPPSFPAQGLGGGNIFNLLTTNRETLTMRRLVTKALVDKANSFTAMICILPQIPNNVEEFKEIFGTVIDRVVSSSPRQSEDGEPRQRPQPRVEEGGNVEVDEAIVSWGRIVTGYAFGLRLIKAAVDQRREGEYARYQQVPHLLDQQPEAEQLRERLRQDQLRWQQLREERLRAGLPAEEEIDPNEWGAAVGQVMHERMGEWVLSQGGWSNGFNDYFLDRRGLEQEVTRKLFCVVALGVGVMLLYKIIKR